MYAENTEKIKIKILEDARNKAADIILKAKLEAKEIKDEAAQMAANIKEKTLSEAQRQAEQEKKRILAIATIRTKKMKLEAKESMIEETFEKAKEEINRITETKTYKEILENLIKQASAEIGSGEIEILVREEDAKLINSSMLSRERIHSPGIIARTKDGRVEVVNTFERRLERMKPLLRLQVAKILFD